MDQCRCFRHQSLTAATARAKRLLAVTCLTMFLPFRDRPQTWVRPRKSKLVPSVSGWRAPSVICGRKSTRRVLSGWSVSPNRARRFPRTASTRLASTILSNAMIASSANRARVLSDVDHPIKSLGPEYVLQSAERLVSRAARAEAVGTGQEVLLVDRLQHHRDGALRHLVLEGWNAEHPLRAIRFWDVRPADRRRAIAAGLDAFEKVQQIGLQVRLIILRRDAVDAGSAVLAGQPVGLPHPIQIDDVVERAQRRPPFRLRQFGYPLSVRGQVCGVQSPLPCV